MDDDEEAVAEEDNENGLNASNSNERWTCEACGCHTNQSTDTNCTICGTSNSGPVLRRPGGANFAARASWLAHGLGVRRGFMNEEIGLDEEDLWETVVRRDEAEAEFSLALAMNATGEGNGPFRYRVLESQQRFMDAARALSQASRESQATEPSQLLRFATENAQKFEPNWKRQSSPGSGRARPSNNRLEIGEGERASLAHVPPGATEGLPVRAVQCFPKNDVSSNFRFPRAASNESTGRLQYRRAYGFRVAFDCPGNEGGSKMGGGSYLVGVATTSFNNFSDPNCLQQSPFFWGVDDSGQKYEGSRGNYSRGSRRQASASSIPNGSPIQGITLNSHGLLFGCREVLTVVADFEGRTLSFWRDETFLGTIVHNIPRTSTYPVVVPWNCGVSVAITGLNRDPLPILRMFALDWEMLQENKKSQAQRVRQRLAEESKFLVHSGKVSDRLLDVLKEIFIMYIADSYTSSTLNEGDLQLKYSCAARLWYRCGLKLSSLNEICHDAKTLSFTSFVDVIQKVIDGEKDHWGSAVSHTAFFEIGDRVELVEGFELFGDCSEGPLQPGDRGIVVDLQNGHNGETRSARVLHNGRRWWYQAQAVVTERSGLLESSDVWFIRRLLRTHGYDHTTLESITGQPVTPSSWHLGDIVCPLSVISSSPPSTSLLGRIVSETADTSSSNVPNKRAGETVIVEFMGRGFAEAAGIKFGLGQLTSKSIDSRRISTSELAHAAGINVVNQIAGFYQGKNSRDTSDRSSVTVKVRSDLDALARFEQSSMENINRECRKSTDALANLFSVGLCEAVLTAVKVAERQMNSLEPKEDLAEKLLCLGNLADSIAQQLFKCEDGTIEVDDGTDLSAPPKFSDIVLDDVENSPPSERNFLDDTNSNDTIAGALGDATSLQQRRNILLSLIANGGNTTAHLNSTHDWRSGIHSQLSPSSLFIRDIQPFMFDSPSDVVDGWAGDMYGRGNSTNKHNPNIGDASPSEECESCTDISKIKAKFTFLDNILRCRSDGSVWMKGMKAAYALFAQNVVSNGVLRDCVEWTKAIVNDHNKKMELIPISKHTSGVNGIVDEEGNSILLLAISFGCSLDMISFLIENGCLVGVNEVRKAAQTNQHDQLALLLKHSIYTEEMVDRSDCSVDVLRTLDAAIARQAELDRIMRESADSFFLNFIRDMFKLILSARRSQNVRLDQCSKAICEVLVGNTLLRALHSAQRGALTLKIKECNDAEREIADKSNRFSLGDFSSELSINRRINRQGLLGSLPISLLGNCLFSQRKYLTEYMMVIEEYLYSKNMVDASFGLSLLLVLSHKFPFSRACSEIKRFGFMELISYHCVLASSRITETMSRQSTPKHSTSVSCKIAKDSNTMKDLKHSAILCPKKHRAVLDITRRASFRCDLCGNGVERGRPMHGCRECDWDACEDCTDMAEGGLVKSTAVRHMATFCLKLLEENNDTEVNEIEERFLHVLRELAEDDTSAMLSALGARLLQRDIEAAKEIGRLLNDPGSVSVHQFMSTILPPLHASLIGTRSAECIVKQTPGPRTKKPKVAGVGTPSDDSHNLRMEYCREALKQIVMDISTPPRRHESTTPFLSPYDTSKVQNDSPKEDTEEDQQVLSRELGYAASHSELLRRLHQILNFNEKVPTISSAEKRDFVASKGGGLQSLTKLIEVQLCPSSSVAPTSDPLVHVEPLLPMEELKLHILRIFRPEESSYDSFCRRLATDCAIVVERSKCHVIDYRWRVAKVVAFDSESGSHTLHRAVSWTSGFDERVLELSSDDLHIPSAFTFSTKPTKLILAAREYYILHRSNAQNFHEFAMHDQSVEGPIFEDGFDHENKTLPPLGTRLESNIPERDTGEVYTLVGCKRLRNHSCDDCRLTLVSDDGELFSDLKYEDVHFIGSDGLEERTQSLRQANIVEQGGILHFPPPRLIEIPTKNELSGDYRGELRKKALKRGLSALSLLDTMQAIDLNIPVELRESINLETGHNPCFECHLENEHFILPSCLMTRIEEPPILSVMLRSNENNPSANDYNFDSMSVIRVLKEMHQEQGQTFDPHESVVQLYFTIQVSYPTRLRTPTDFNTSKHSIGEIKNIDEKWCPRLDSRSRKLSSRSVGSEDEVAMPRLCEGIDELCLQCMEIVSLLVECTENSSGSREKDDSSLSGFASSVLSNKLSEQLDDPLVVVSGCLPKWCLEAPSITPRIFKYDTRRTLLERAAFGVSRSILKQQEAKVNVSRLRQRMSCLRGRAVELVSEAFSGGAEDPTALQLQADELYGMEEALAGRVRDAFRAAKWREYSLQVAKAAVRRDYLLIDAAVVMERYAKDPKVCRRRLEVRFDGESGFDAASGDEAGVTRGFYADVAEALLSVENVAGIYCAYSCTFRSSATAAAKVQSMEADENVRDSSKLPLWIPDMDNSSSVIIPTPRADKRSGLGVYPRPIPCYHPQFNEVLQKFRFMGRLFAAAMRDGFMFPLPLSSSFLKLVQNGKLSIIKKESVEDIVSWLPTSILSSTDLPRPGFLGGEIFAAEYFICRKLDELDTMIPALSRTELQRRYEELESDKSFGRLALAKNYDLSFKEYFEDRSFVDPLDPSQGEDAVPLCSKGFQKNVTIYNIREWVSLAKYFMLYDGVIAQAMSFRDGIEDFFLPKFLCIFTADELQRDVCGTGGDVDNWDEGAVRKLFKLDGGKGAAEALVAVAAIGGEGGAALSRRFGPSSPTIAFLVKALLEASPDQRRQFLSFVTSVPIVTPGRIEVVPIVSPSGEFVSVQDPACLPRANTCSRRLYLPKFESFDFFSEVLWAVVREESKFKGFYEWRGT